MDTVEAVNTVNHGRGVDRFGLAALAGAGTLVAHQVGYLADGADTVSHAYFGALGPIVAFTACAAAWVSALRVLRGDPGRLPSLVALAGLQAVMFAVLEVGERVTSGSLASLPSAPVIAGLICQPLVAWAALRVLGLGRSVLERWRRARSRLAASSFLDVLAPAGVVVSSPAVARLRVRGPPA